MQSHTHFSGNPTLIPPSMVNFRPIFKWPLYLDLKGADSPQSWFLRGHYVFEKSLKINLRFPTYLASSVMTNRRLTGQQRGPQCGSLWSGEARWASDRVRRTKITFRKRFDPFQESTSTDDWRAWSVSEASAAFNAWSDECATCSAVTGACKWFTDWVIVAAFLEKSLKLSTKTWWWKLATQSQNYTLPSQLIMLIFKRKMGIEQMDANSFYFFDGAKKDPASNLVKLRLACFTVWDFLRSLKLNIFVYYELFSVCVVVPLTLCPSLLPSFQLLCSGGPRPSHYTGFGQPSVRGGALGVGAVQNHRCPEDALCKDTETHLKSRTHF